MLGTADLSSLFSDKGFAANPFEKEPAERGIELLRPSFKREKRRYGEPMPKKVRPLGAPVTRSLIAYDH